jgi:hypothetical protein
MKKPAAIRTSRAKSSALVLAATALALLAPLAPGAEETRESCVAAVEPICKTNTKANEKILSGVRREVRQAS